jgi:predicted RNA binding protein YcfA (HicA-like mRNA interferase family)
VRERAPLWREVLTELRQLGGVPVRRKGSHEVWEFPGQVKFVAIINHLGEPLRPNVLAEYRRVRARLERP